ncbi:MAG: co-chaperone DjlA [Acidiferrobacterales bacterium]|nr:co-chaperone DjlA [Acidiferrobacterales bacterium]
MAWWGKLIGGALGFLIGGPLGALLGASFGHNFDGDSSGDRPRALPGDQERTQAAFFTATFSVMGYVAKSDGRVSSEEIQLANALMDEMQLPEAQKKVARNLFTKGKQPDFDFDGVMAQFRKECHRRTTLLRMFLEIQVQAAFADQRLDPKENRILKEIASLLGFRTADLEQLIDLVRGGAEAQAHPETLSLEDAYKVLGANEKMTLVEVKKSYRKLLSQHHPDKLVSRGLPEEMIELANEKTREIKTAWQTIKSARGGR